MLRKKVGVFWFTNDLRVEDNQLLKRAAQEVDQLICLYCMPRFSEYLQHFSLETRFGESRQRFLHQSIAELDEILHQCGQHLVVTDEHPFTALVTLIKSDDVTHIYCDDFASYDEQLVVEHLQCYFPLVEIVQREQRTLLCRQQLPFHLEDLPASFSKFRKQVEKLAIDLPVDAELALPPPCSHSLSTVEVPSLSVSSHDQFVGGERFALAHVSCYFASSFASHYKQTRNELDGMEFSTKFSPWLAVGCISPKQIIGMLRQYEQRNGSNDSTYWIYFELLWREYFQWYAAKYGKQLFHFAGILGKAPLTTFYPQRFKQWVNGNTVYPLVNACMNQLRETGYMSNRGRQLVASCLVHELGIDWRYGAAYFESQLIDYDVGSNWGNWQYIAGVGASKTPRRFDQAKQMQIYDPQGEFVQRWGGNRGKINTDSVDMVDWPIRA
ncbi:DASH family cryptochrome [Vibrio panuliri]|uniref:DASH family cryptochrome n=1 Tax=Vibrio panuliri TaxID=1381081 RepID=UPI000AE5BDA5|nr:DASH family cryptochrome [Vibrio panuliri]